MRVEKLVISLIHQSLKLVISWIQDPGSPLQEPHKELLKASFYNINIYLLLYKRHRTERGMDLKRGMSSMKRRDMT